MQANLLVVPTATFSRTTTCRRHRWAPLVLAAAASSSSSSSFTSSSCSSQNHYTVLGLDLSATSVDIKRAYRLLARKYHPDVSKDSQASEVFMSIHHAYEVLSNEVTRTQYDRALKFREESGRHYRRQRNGNVKFNSGPKIYRWDELRRRMQRDGYWEENNSREESSSFSDTIRASQKGNQARERGSFNEVLRSAFVSLFLLQAFGSRLSLTLSSLMALLDRKLDAGYKVGYMIAWILGGRRGILLTLCLSFASWACGKTSSSQVALVMAAMWFGVNFARSAPLPQGALLTLLYMSLKLQVDLK